MPPLPTVEPLLAILPPKQRPAAITSEELDTTHENILIGAIAQHRAGSLPTVPMVPTIHQVKDGIRQLSIDMRTKHKKLLRLKFIRDHQANPYKRTTLPIHINPATLYPTKLQLMNTTKFSKSHRKKMYKTQTAAPHILLPLLKEWIPVQGHHPDRTNYRSTSQEPG
jgi:hypothetical protein